MASNAACGAKKRQKPPRLAQASKRSYSPGRTAMSLELLPAAALRSFPVPADELGISDSLIETREDTAANPQPLYQLEQVKPADASLAIDPLASITAARGTGHLDLGDTQIVTSLIDSLSHYSRNASAVGARNLTGLAEANLRYIYSAYGSARGTQRDKVLNACARYAEFLGWLHQDLGNSTLSLFWTDRALEWAQEGDDSQFLSYIWMRKSDHAEQYGSSDRVVSLARLSSKIPALSPRANALAAQQQARGYSQRGEQELFERMINQAREFLGKAGGDNSAP